MSLGLYHHNILFLEIVTLTIDLNGQEKQVSLEAQGFDFP